MKNIMQSSFIIGIKIIWLIKHKSWIAVINLKNSCMRKCKLRQLKKNFWENYYKITKSSDKTLKNYENFINISIKMLE